MAASRIPILGGLDLTALFLFVAHGVGRISCFNAGCCYGTQTDSFLGFVFPGMSSPVHPTQLYESFALFAGFFIIWSFRKKLISAELFSVFI
jgi:phosphatidylglycerol:prolipoprotein diacylglycerol transferase